MLRHPAVIVALLAVHVSSWAGAGLFVCRAASGAVRLDHGRLGCTACDAANSCGASCQAEEHGLCESEDVGADCHGRRSDSARPSATYRVEPQPCDCEHDAVSSTSSVAPLRGAAAWDHSAAMPAGTMAPAIVPTAPTRDTAHSPAAHASATLAPRLRALDTIALRC